VAILFKSSSLSFALHHELWIVWNIGQGQWVTHVTPEACRHYDFGGEAGSFNRIKFKLFKLCGDKPNQLLLSHWDFDHYLNLKNIVQTLPQVCWLKAPSVIPDKKTVAQMLALPIFNCNRTEPVQIWTPVQSQNLNESSNVFIENNFLMPGDSDIRKEKIWATQMNQIPRVRVLILGHHGSRTSTGSALLEKLGHLRMTVASARFKKYKHPHPETVLRVQKRHVALLKTEDWGHLIFSY
jgi:competence protein ComEC